MGIASGWRSDEMMICLFAPWRELNVWKNSSWSPSLLSMNWMSSIMQHVDLAVPTLERRPPVFVRMASTNSFRNTSVET